MVCWALELYVAGRELTPTTTSTGADGGSSRQEQQGRYKSHLAAGRKAREARWEKGDAKGKGKVKGKTSGKTTFVLEGQCNSKMEKICLRFSVGR